MTSSSKRLEAELGRRLKASPYLNQLFGGEPTVTTYAPETSDLPYIVYNETRLTAWDDDKRNGGEHTILLQVWSKGESEAWVKDALHGIRDAIHRCERQVDLSPYKLVMIDLEYQDVRRETDGQAYSGTAQFRALTGGGY